MMPYKFNPLREATNYRLMHLEPGNVSDEIWFSLSEHPGSDDDVQYHAISYAWESNDLTHTIYSTDGYLKITRNLFHALRRYRRTDQPVLLWVDAICISQHDSDEKGQQVQLMGKTFSRSHEVLVWVGEEAATDKLAIDFINDIVHARLDRLVAGVHDPTVLLPVIRELIEELHNPELIRSITSFFERSWFSRSWTYQEILCARQATLSCGLLETDYNSIFEFALVWFVHGLSFTLTSQTAVKNLAQIAMGWMQREEYRKGFGNTSFAHLVYSTRWLKCTDPRDKIYSVLGIAVQPSPLPYPPDYNIEADRLYRDFAAHEIQKSQSLEILQMCSLGGDVVSRSTWAPDWSFQESNAIQIFAGQPYRAAGSHQLRRFPCTRVGELRIEGFIVEKVAHLSSVLTELPSERFVSIDENINTRFSRQHTLVQETWDMAFSVRRASDKNGGYDEWWRTLMGDKASDEVQATPETLVDFEVYRRVLSALATKDILESISDADMSKFAHVERLIFSLASYRKFCVTEQGRLGWVCQFAELGDVVSILFGSATPILLRPKNESFRVVGPCYIHGLMFGEAMTEENLLQARPISLI